jgi:hypothetical protein
MKSQGQKSDLENEVIVRAFGNEPVRLVVLAQSERYVEVSRPGESASITLPRDLVFPFDDTKFREMSDVYRRGDKAKLAVLWDLMASGR